MQRSRGGLGSHAVHDCEPTMTDSEVLQFCRVGILKMESIIPDDINQRVLELCEKHDGGVPIDEDWYIDNVTLNPKIAGVVRTLLGKDFQYPLGAQNRKVQCPAPSVGGWHNDGRPRYTPAVDCLQMFYYPQDTPEHMGPTQALPGSHFLYSVQQHMSHYGRIKNAMSTAAPAGSVWIMFYRIWHRRGSATGPGFRNLMQHWYLRTTPPQRDWVREPGFNLESGKGPPEQPLWYHREPHRAAQDALEIFYWLSGNQQEFERQMPYSLPVFLGMKLDAPPDSH